MNSIEHSAKLMARYGAPVASCLMLGFALSAAAVLPPAFAQSCVICDHCTATGRTVVTISGATATRVTRTDVNNTSFDLTHWFSDAVTGPGKSYAFTPSGSDICTTGGTINGHIPLDLDWRSVHDAIGGAGIRIFVGSGPATVLDARIHNVEDGFQPREKPTYNNQGTMNVRGAYMTMIRDDCIENDDFMPGEVEDSLFDGAFCFYSEQEQSGLSLPQTTIGPNEDPYVRFTNVYVRTDATNAVLQPPDTVTVGFWFKYYGAVAHHTPLIKNSTFAVSAVPIYKGAVRWDRLKFPAGTTWSGVDNYLLWLGTPGQYRGPRLADLTLAPGAQVTFLEGAAAQSKWQQLKQHWLCTHDYLPAGVIATPGSGQVSLSWTAAKKAVSYDVLRSATSGGPYGTIASGLTGTSYVDTTGTKETKYYYVVAAVDYCGTAPTTVEVSAAPGNAAVSASSVNLATAFAPAFDR